MQLLDQVGEFEDGLVVGVLLLGVLEQETEMQVAVAASNWQSALGTLVLLPDEHTADTVIAVGMLIDTYHPGYPVPKVKLLLTECALQ